MHDINSHSKGLLKHANTIKREKKRNLIDVFFSSNLDNFRCCFKNLRMCLKAFCK